MKSQTGRRDFERFKRGIAAALRKLGIDGAWDVRFRYVPGLDSQAESTFDVPHRMVTMEFGGLSGTCSMHALTRHEAVHVLVAEMAHLSQERYTSEDAMIAAEERVATILEKILP